MQNYTQTEENGPAHGLCNQYQMEVDILLDVVIGGLVKKGIGLNHWTRM